MPHLFKERRKTGIPNPTFFVTAEITVIAKENERALLYALRVLGGLSFGAA
jgi:hypothetical protein